MTQERGTLNPSEPHPMAHNAHRYIISRGHKKNSLSLEALSSCAIEGNRLAEVCAETLRRVMYNEPVSDRYILGLSWYLKELDEEEEDDLFPRGLKDGGPISFNGLYDSPVYND